MEKKKIVLTSTAVIGVASFLLICTNFPSETKVTSGVSVSGHVDMDSANCVNGTTGVEETGSINTRSGYALTFKYKDVAALNNGFGTIAAGGYVYNSGVSPINGITSIAITFGNATPNVNLLTGSSALLGNSVSITSGTSYTYTPATGDNINYFKIVGVAETPISSINIQYSCTTNTQEFTYGRYPQTVLEDTDAITELNKISSPGTDGYYTYNGEEYAKVTARPYYYSPCYRSGTIVKSGTAYYFKVEPIKWRVLSYDADGNAVVISDQCLDTSYYYNGESTRTPDGVTINPNNYEYSEIRAFLNGYDGSKYNVTNYTNAGFIDKAFTATEQAKILTTTVDNSAASTRLTTNSYACEDTADKMFVLSVKECFTTALFPTNNSRKAECSDYPRAKYIGMNRSNINLPDDYLTRSPRGDGATSTFVMYSSGIQDSTGNFYIFAVRPSMRIKM